VNFDPFGLVVLGRGLKSAGRFVEALDALDVESKLVERPADPLGRLETDAPEGAPGRCGPPPPSGGMPCEFTRLNPTLTRASLSNARAGASGGAACRVVPHYGSTSLPISQIFAGLPTDFRNAPGDHTVRGNG
jgi:hypothetical protein